MEQSGKRRLSQDSGACANNAKKARRDPTPTIEDLKTFITQSHPDLLQTATFVPPIHMNKQHHTIFTFEGVDLQTLQSPVKDLPSGSPPALQDSDVRDDTTHRLVLHCLWILTNNLHANPSCRMMGMTGATLVMTVISQLDFENYLSDPCYAAIANTLPTLKALPANLRRGDLDILIILRQHGLLIMEVKAVGDRFDSKLTENEKDAIIQKKLDQAVKQLEKNKDVVKHLVSDKQSPGGQSIPVRAVIALPNVTRPQISRILLKDSSLRQKMCQCLDIPAREDPADYCMCADDLPTRNSVDDVTNSQSDTMGLVTWWQRVFPGNGSNCSMTEDMYIELVARFCGPATYAPSFAVVKAQNHGQGKGSSGSDQANRQPYVHKMDEAVSLTGDKFTRQVLVQDQIDVLEKGPPLLYIDGAPGTGKTVALMLKARQWLVLGNHVHVVSTCSSSMAASSLIAYELRQQFGHCQNRVHLHTFELKDEEMENAVNCLLKEVQGGQLFVVCDEAFASSNFSEFCTKLEENCMLHLWAASVYFGYRPAHFNKTTFDIALRTPPNITQQIKKSGVIRQGMVHPYRDSEAPLPCDGPHRMEIKHQGSDHSNSWAGNCEECGRLLAIELKRLCSGNTTTPLKFRDVFLLTCFSSYELENDRLNDDGEIEHEGSSLLKELTRAGVPVRVLSKADQSAIERVASMNYEDEVVAAEADAVRGLERKVVVWVNSGFAGTDLGEMDFGRLDAVSRTTALLITVGRCA